MSQSFRTAVLVAVVAVVAVLGHGSALAARPAVSLTAALGHGAALGSATSVHVGLRIDTRRAPSPPSRIRILYASGLGVTTSGLGLDVCRRPSADFVRVMGGHSRGLRGCPRNAVMALGTARGEIRIDDETIRATARVTVLAGLTGSDGIGLVAFVDGVNPFAVRLTYGGLVRDARPPFGGVLEIRLPPIPNEFDAAVALTGIDATIGSRQIVYHDDDGTAYRPEGVMLPGRCPRPGLPFRAEVTFQDGTTAASDFTVRCPV